MMTYYDDDFLRFGTLHNDRIWDGNRRSLCDAVAYEHTRCLVQLSRHFGGLSRCLDDLAMNIMFHSYKFLLGQRYRCHSVSSACAIKLARKQRMPLQ